MTEIGKAVAVRLEYLRRELEIAEQEAARDLTQTGGLP